MAIKKDVIVLLFVESRYRLNRKRVYQAISRELKGHGVIGPVEVSIAIIGDRKMRKLNKKYRNLDKTTNVLSFPIAEGEAAVMPDTSILRLGDIAISYPQVIKEAAAEEMLVDDKIEELVLHSLSHLLGIHHD